MTSNISAGKYGIEFFGYPLYSCYTGQSHNTPTLAGLCCGGSFDVYVWLYCVASVTQRPRSTLSRGHNGALLIC